MRYQQDKYSKARQQSFYEIEQANLKEHFTFSLAKKQIFTTLDLLDIIECSDGNGPISGPIDRERPNRPYFHPRTDPIQIYVYTPILTDGRNYLQI